MIFPYPPNVRDWLTRLGNCGHCRQSYSAPPCGPGGGPGSNDHYRTCLDLAFQFLQEQAEEDELNQPEEEMELIG